MAGRLVEARRLAPGRERLDRRAQLAAGVGQRVADAQRPLGCTARCCTRPAPSRRRGATASTFEEMPGSRGLQLAVAALAVQQRGQHEQRPAVADGADGLVETEQSVTPSWYLRSHLQLASHSHDSLTDLAERLRPFDRRRPAWRLGRRRRAGRRRDAVAQRARRRRHGRRSTGGEAELLGADRSADLAVLRVDASLPPRPVVRRRPAADRRPGVRARRPGRPRPARDGRRGVVAPRAPVRGPGGRLIEGALEHTAPLPRGSGGGPLVDADGAILGLNALRAGDGLIVAWPASALRERAQQLAARTLDRAADARHRPGRPAPGAPAARRRGLGRGRRPARPRGPGGQRRRRARASPRGDVITAANGTADHGHRRPVRGDRRAATRSSSRSCAATRRRP